MESNENNGMMTKVWGPPAWIFLHCVTFGYPVDPDKFDAENNQIEGTTKMRYKQFFEYVKYIFPCKYCRISYAEYLEEEPVDVENRKTLTKWLWKIHNKVNEKLQVKYNDASFENVKKRYENYRAKCNKGKQVGCTIPINGKKLKSMVWVVPDICTSVLISMFLVLVFILYVVSR
jgi:hypothetical protein